MKISHFIVFSIIILLSLPSYSQGFHGADQSYKIADDTLVVYQTVNFSFGSPGSCPPLDSSNFEAIDDTIKLFVRYDDRGGWPAFGCGQLDTLSYKVKNLGFYTLIVNTHLYKWNQTEEEYYNLQVDSDTIYAVNVDVSENQLDKNNGIELYPNPAKHQVQLKTNNSITSITLFDVLAHEIKRFDPNHILLNLTSIPAGNYFLKVNTTKGTLVEKLFIE